MINSLSLPAACRVDQRVPKKLLMENGAPTAADRRQIKDGIEQISWIAALKPTTIGIAAHRDDQREYLEIAVVAVTLSGAGVRPAKMKRVSELIHRAIPYPVFLLLRSEQGLTLSLAHKRWAQNEAGKVVLDGDPISAALPADAPSVGVLAAFIEALALTNRPYRTLFDLYQHWTDSLVALLAARLTGTFAEARTPERAAARRRALQDSDRLEREITRLQAQAGKERQLARQVELNRELKRLQSTLIDLRESL